MSYEITLYSDRYKLVLHDDIATVYDVRDTDSGPVFTGSPEEADYWLQVIANQDLRKWEIEAAKRVDEYANSGPRTKGSVTIQARRIMAALRAIGIKRTGFRVRTEFDRRAGVYGQAHGSIFSHEDSAIALEHIRFLVRCGLTVHVINRTESRESVFVTTSDSPRIISYAQVSSSARSVLRT